MSRSREGMDGLLLLYLVGCGQKRSDLVKMLSWCDATLSHSAITLSRSISLRYLSLSVGLWVSPSRRRWSVVDPIDGLDNPSITRLHVPPPGVGRSSAIRGRRVQSMSLTTDFIYMYLPQESHWCIFTLLLNVAGVVWGKVSTMSA